MFHLRRKNIFQCIIINLLSVIFSLLGWLFVCTLNHIYFSVIHFISLAAFHLHCCHFISCFVTFERGGTVINYRMNSFLIRNSTFQTLPGNHRATAISSITLFCFSHYGSGTLTSHAVQTGALLPQANKLLSRPSSSLQS